MITSFIRYLFKQIWFFVLCCISQLSYTNENQNFISNFVFQFIKKSETAIQVHVFKLIKLVSKKWARFDSQVSFNPAPPFFTVQSYFLRLLKLYYEFKFIFPLSFFFLKENIVGNRGVFRTQSNIYDGAFLQNQLTAFSRHTCSIGF